MSFNDKKGQNWQKTLKSNTKKNILVHVPPLPSSARCVWWSYRVPVGEVELPRVFEDEVLTLLPFWILVFQINPEALDVLDTCRDTDRFQLPVPTSHNKWHVHF